MATPRGVRTPVVLIVLDGWGFRPGREGNAIELGETPVWHRLWDRAPRTLLDASGLAVGLPEGQMGNSEVGHLNLGAGRVIYQDILRITRAIRDGSFHDNPALTTLCDGARAAGRPVHLMGLVSDGGVHSLDQHLFALVELARRRGVSDVRIHAFLDGRGGNAMRLNYSGVPEATISEGVRRIGVAASEMTELHRALGGDIS